MLFSMCSVASNEKYNPKFFLQEVRRVKPDAEVVSFFAVSWNSLQTTPEAEKKNNAPKSNDIVYYRPRNTVKVPGWYPPATSKQFIDTYLQRSRWDLDADEYVCESSQL